MAENQLEKVHEMLEDFETALLVTHSAGGGLRARPMAVAEVEPNCDLWFFTGRDTSKVHEIKTDDRVLVVFQDERSRYLSLTGVAEVTSNRARVEELWKETYRIWFPSGPDDPSLALIRVRAEEAEYWDNQGMKGVQYVFQAAKAYATGTKPHPREGEQHGRVAMK